MELGADKGGGSIGRIGGKDVETEEALISSAAAPRYRFIQMESVVESSARFLTF